MKAAVLDKLGLPGIAGIGLMLFCLAFYFGSVSPVEAELAGLQSEKASLSAEAATLAEKTAATRTAEAALRLPPLGAAPELLKQLDSLAQKNGISVERASYQVKNKERQQRLEVSMPLRVSYPALRAYLRDALSLAPSASLDDLSLQRSQASDPAVDVQLRLSYGFSSS